MLLYHLYHFVVYHMRCSYMKVSSYGVIFTSCIANIKLIIYHYVDDVHVSAVRILHVNAADDFASSWMLHMWFRNF